MMNFFHKNIFNEQEVKNFCGNNNVVVVVLFLYKEKISEIEKTNLLMAEKFLDEFPIIIFQPKNKKIENPIKNACVVKIDDRHFDGISAYNKIMLSYKFYANFKNLTENILIIQPDVTIVNKISIKKILKNKSMLGARWEEKISIIPVIGRRFGRLHKYLPKFLICKADFPNGGLSLRKVEYFCKILKWNLHACVWRDSEDVYFAQKITDKYDNNFLDEFALECHANKIKKITGEIFGFHALDRHNISLLRDVHESFLKENMFSSSNNIE